MRTPVLLMLLAALSITGCNAQEKKKTIAPLPGSKTEQVSPEVKTRVVKRYDDKRNVIGYDPTYTWSYSGKNGQLHQVYVDSLLKQFKVESDSKFPALFSKDLGSPIWDDSLFYKDLTSSGHFMQKWKQHMFDMPEMM